MLDGLRQGLVRIGNASMSHSYRAVGWNRNKWIYDSFIAAGVTAYLAVFVAGGALLDNEATIETLLIRGFGTAALLLLHIILSIGPLCRLDSRFLPLLYNRRHLGVTMFVLAAAHGVFAIVQFHGWGDVHPFVSVLSSSRDWTSLTDFPFQPLGLAALGILLVMAATSHDFWLRALSAPVWKSLHMLVYVAYALIVAHVALGVLQVESHPLLAALIGLGLAWILGLHLLSAWRERRADADNDLSEEFVDVCGAKELADNRARIACVAGERVAVFRYGDRVSAVSNVCRHQNGPLGEGRIVNGCIVCPWHGYEYEPASGRAPAPFTERLPTFSVRVVRGRVQVSSRPHPPGTYVEPAHLSS
jgi:methionine sulfoxide reductase heme-binding subunit